MLEEALIFVFGGLGCLCRYLVGGLSHRILGYTFPYGTLAANILGSFGLAFFMEIALYRLPLDPSIRLGIATGFFGGFTTFSSFSYETVKLFEEGSFLLAGLNVLSNVIICLVAAFLGFHISRRFIA